MQKKFVSTLLLLLFLNLLVKPLWIFGIDLTVQNRVGAEEYGIYFALFNFSLFFNILLDFGLTHYNNQAVAKNSRTVKSNFSHLTSLKFLLGLIYLLITLILGWVFGYDGQAFWLLIILAFNQFLASLLLFLRSNLAGLQHFRADSFLSVIDKTLMIIICGILLTGIYTGDDFTVFHFVWAQSASYLLTVIIAFLMVWNKVKIFKWKVKLENYRKGLKQSFPYAMLILLMSLYTRVDAVMLDRMVGSYENGVYAAAFRLLDAINQFGYLFAVLLLPMFSRMLAKKENVGDLTRLSFNIIFVALLGIVLVGGTQANEIMDYLYHLKDESLPVVFQLLLLSSLAFGTTFIFGTLLTATNNLKTLNYIAFIGFLLNVILNLYLIPVYKAEGAAIATLITQAITALAQVFYCFKYVKIELPSFYLLRFLGFILLSMGVAVFLQQKDIPFLPKTALILGEVFLCALMFRLLNFQAAWQMLKSGIKN